MPGSVSQCELALTAAKLITVEHDSCGAGTCLNSKSSYGTIDARGACVVSMLAHALTTLLGDWPPGHFWAPGHSSDLRTRQNVRTREVEAWVAG